MGKAAFVISMRKGKKGLNFYTLTVISKQSHEGNSGKHSPGKRRTKFEHGNCFFPPNFALVVNFLEKTTQN